MNLVEKIKNAGVVGAGGAGFPTHVKVGAEVEWLLVNAAECEPLMHKDKEIMQNYADTIVQGIQYVADHTKAQKIVIGIKSKNTQAIKSLNAAIDKAKAAITLHEFDDYYPAGDEYEIVAGITGKLMPPGGIPLDIGAVVSNVETLYNIAHAVDGKPVTNKFLTVAGAVKQPVTVYVPVGTIYEDVIELAGGSPLPA
ncbi:MAG: proton-conducting membrane transporter, partial [Calditrichaeota bacterium]